LVLSLFFSVCNAVKQYGLTPFSASSARYFSRSLVLLSRVNSDEAYERTFLFLTGRWDDELIQFMTSLFVE